MSELADLRAELEDARDRRDVLLEQEHEWTVRVESLEDDLEYAEGEVRRYQEEADDLRDDLDDARDYRADTQADLEYYEREVERLYNQIEALEEE